MHEMLKTEIVSGHCPACELHTLLVGINQSLYKCTNCGEDLEQKVNGVIKYIPRTHMPQEDSPES